MRIDRVELHPLWRVSLEKFMQEMAVGCDRVESDRMPSKDARILAKNLAGIFDDGTYDIRVDNRHHLKRPYSVIVAIKKEHHSYLQVERKWGKNRTTRACCSEILQLQSMDEFDELGIAYGIQLERKLHQVGFWVELEFVSENTWCILASWSGEQVYVWETGGFQGAKQFYCAYTLNRVTQAGPNLQPLPMLVVLHQRCDTKQA